jgi:ribonuclease HII
MALNRIAPNRLVPGVGGVDEAGRGPLAGPVVAAVVVMSAGQKIDGVRDSKQLSAARRETLAEQIKHEAVGWSLGRATVEEIDELNILQATMLAMRRAIEELGFLPERLQFDGDRAPPLRGYYGLSETIIGGDRLCIAISAASILAKVDRDREMIALDRDFPDYGFARHKGYATAEHRAALQRFGACPVHRRSFRPVQLAIKARVQAAWA